VNWHNLEGNSTADTSENTEKYDNMHWKINVYNENMGNESAHFMLF
jgi:hypothetical protein